MIPSLLCSLCLQHAGGRKHTKLLQASGMMYVLMHWLLCRKRTCTFPSIFGKSSTHSAGFSSQRQPLLDNKWSTKFSTNFILQSQKRPTSPFLYIVTGRRAPNPPPPELTELQRTHVGNEHQATHPWLHKARGNGKHTLSTLCTVHCHHTASASH